MEINAKKQEKKTNYLWFFSISSWFHQVAIIHIFYCSMADIKLAGN
jgi:hypothetical protein